MEKLMRRKNKTIQRLKSVVVRGKEKRKKKEKEL